MFKVIIHLKEGEMIPVTKTVTRSNGTKTNIKTLAPRTTVTRWCSNEKDATMFISVHKDNIQSHRRQYQG